MGIMGDIFKQSGSMQKAATKNEFAGRIYPTGQGPTPEEVATHESRAEAKRIEWGLDIEVAECMRKIGEDVTDNKEKISTIYAVPFGRDMEIHVASGLWLLEKWMFDFAQTLKTGKVKLRTDGDTQAAVDFMANYLISHNCYPVGGFGQDLVQEGGRIIPGLSFRTVVPGAGIIGSFGMCTIHAFETSSERTGKNPTWKVWLRANDGIGTKSPISDEARICAQQMSSEVYNCTHVSKLEKLVKDNLRVLNVISDGNRAGRTTMSRYFTYKLGIPAEVLSTSEYLSHLEKSLGDCADGAIRQFGSGGGHHVELRIPATIYNPNLWSDPNTVPALIKVVVSLSDTGELTSMHDTLIQCGHYKEGLDGEKWAPSYIPNDPALSRTNIYIGLA